MNFKTKDLLTLAELNNDEIHELIAGASALKEGRYVGDIKGKTVSLVFKKSSTRTRVSFEAGIHQLGGFPIYLHSAELQLGRGETIADTGNVLSRYTDAIVMRTHEHKEVEELALSAGIPVINALTDEHHPCQALADLMTLKEKKGHLKGIKLAYVGDGNNVCDSLLVASKLTGIEMKAATPKGFEPKKEILKMVDGLDGEGSYEILNDPVSCVEGADAVYTDVWLSMGEEALDKKKKRFAGFQLNQKLMEKADKNAIAMHCLPAHRGEEITAEVLEGGQSVVFDQAENRLHTQKSLMVGLLG